MKESLKRGAWLIGALAFMATALPSAAAEVIIATGPLSNISSVGNFAEYQFQWASSRKNRTFLELDFQLNDGVPAPQETTLWDEAIYLEYHKPEHEFWPGRIYGRCDIEPVCEATVSTPAPGLTRIRYETLWGHHPYYLINIPIGPITVDYSAEFAQDVGFAPYTATYRILAVPEPQGWALMILGFAGAGAALRRSRAPHRRRV